MVAAGLTGTTSAVFNIECGLDIERPADFKRVTSVTLTNPADMSGCRAGGKSRLNVSEDAVDGPAPQFTADSVCLCDRLRTCAPMNAIVLIALRRPYTFVVLAILILIFGGRAALRTPTDIFPNIGIPVVAAVWT